jgi:uncharacterized protein (DUF433 family)
MLPIEIHNRGRGPELKGTRITVYDIIPYRLKGWTAEGIAEVLRPGYPDITAAHIEALFRYMDEHHDEVMAVHWRIEERNARGNPPEIEEKLKQSRVRVQAKMEEFRRKRAAAVTEPLPGGTPATPPADVPPPARV